MFCTTRRYCVHVATQHLALRDAPVFVHNALDPEQMRTTSAFLRPREFVSPVVFASRCLCALSGLVMFVIIVMCGRSLQKLVQSSICGVVKE